MKRDRVSVTDAMLLLLETPTTPMNVGMVAIFDGGPLLDDDGKVRIDAVRTAAASSLSKRQRSRQRPVPVPWGLGRAVWVDDESFALEHHLDSVTLREPSREALMELAADLLMEPLPDSRPLWSHFFVDGLPDGQIALVGRLHHALRDGEGAMSAFDSMFNITPEVPTIPPAEPWTPAPHPSRWSLATDAVAHQVRHAGKLARVGARAIRHPKRAVAWSRRAAGAIGPFMGKTEPVPRLSFNQPASDRRVLATFALSLDDCKTVRAAFGCTVNDVLVAVVAGGTRRLLSSRGECGPDTSVTVGCAVSLRAAGDDSAGNQTTAFTVKVDLAEADPVVRLRQVHAGTSQAKNESQADDMARVMELADFVVPSMMRAPARKFHEQKGYNLGVSNLMGPPVPVWLLGARMREVYPFGPLMRYTGMTVTALSYDGRFFVGVNADAELLPDIDVFTAGVEAELAELLARAGEADRP